MAAKTQTPALEQTMRQAVIHHQAGRLQQAEQLYRTILEAHPGHPDASHNLGVMAVQAGRTITSLNHFNAALAAHPDQAQCWLNYLDALLRIGRANATHPGEASTGAPAEKQALHDIAHLFASMQYEEATRSAHTKLFRNNAAAHFYLGNTLLHLKLPKEAEESYQRALQIRPDYAWAHNNLGYVLREMWRLDDAQTCCDRSLQLDPNCAEAHNNLGVILYRQGRTDEAEKSYREAMRLAPRYVEAHNNLGRMLHELGRIDEAEEVFRQELRQNPDSAEAHYHLAIFLLRSGNMAEGWKEYAHRWEGSLPRVPRPNPPQPQWSGEPVPPNDSLLVYGEQGFGDRLQFSRYLPLALARFPAGVSCIVEQPLQRLFRRSFPAVNVLDEAPLQPPGWQCPMLSLPLAFGTTPETIPAQIPYLIAGPEQIGYWQSRIKALGQNPSARKIGLVWKPGSGMPNAAERSVALSQLKPLFELPDTISFSLQKEPDPDMAAYAGKLVDWTEELTDFDETAALMMNMDLVISVDTAAAHLAGGLGRPVWLLNRKSGEWRWLQGKESSPWYPTMRIFTQHRHGDWDEVVARMAALLKERPA